MAVSPLNEEPPQRVIQLAQLSQAGGSQPQRNPHSPAKVLEQTSARFPSLARLFESVMLPSSPGAGELKDTCLIQTSKRGRMPSIPRASRVHRKN